MRKFAVLSRAKAENRPAIGKGGARSGGRSGEISGQDRNRIFRPQAIVGAGEIAGEIKLGAQILAGIEEDRGRLQDRRLYARVSGPGQMSDDAFGALIGKRQRSAPESSVKSASLSKVRHVARHVLQKWRETPAKPLSVAGQDLPHRVNKLIFRDAELRFGAQFEIVGAVLGGSGEFGAEHEIADRHLRAFLMIALVRALDDGADGAAFVGIFVATIGEETAFSAEKSRETPMEKPVAGTFSARKRPTRPS